MQRKTRNMMLSRILCMMLIVAMALFTVGCKKDEEESPKEQDAKVTAPATEDAANEIEEGQDAESGEDATQEGDVASDVTELGEGKKAFDFSVVDKDGNETKFVIHTDKSTVGEALLDLGLIEGEAGAYGLYVKKVNGILADYDVDQTYWGFYVDGDYAMSGVDTTDIEEGKTYSFKVSK
ncbi:MAG: DUF4430 domain-containing protein [Lachnospiraceae bacterium]|nr:DUF4430 domain-containing protein [Lachnospiraceae bacterium]